MSAPLLATVAQLAAAVDDDIDDDDPTALVYLQTAGGIVRGELNQFISSVAGDVKRLTPSGNGRTAFLAELPVTAVTLLEVFQYGTWSTIASTNYDVDTDTGIIEVYAGGWSIVPSIGRGWRVTYSHGYETEDLPDAIVGAVLGLASRAWMTPIGVDNERVGQRSIKYSMEASGFSAEEQIGLDALKVPRAG